MGTGICKFEYESGQKCKNITHSDASDYCVIHKPSFPKETEDKIISTAQKLVEQIAPPNTEEILKQRGSIYGDVRDNMNCAGDLIGVLIKYSQNNPLFLKDVDDYNKRGHNGCLEMVCHKLARIVTGATIHGDNYDDVGGYIKLARDIVIKE